MKNTRSFTLVELLVVVAIISVLATITVMGINAVQNSSKVKATESFMQRVVSATTAFSTETGAFPWPATSDVIVIDPNTSPGDLDKYKEFFSILAYKNYAGKKNLKDLNKSKKSFLKVDDSFESNNFELKDIWGKYYVLWYDGESFEEVDNMDESAEVRSKRMPVTFGVISLGGDKVFNNVTRKDYKKFSYWDGSTGDIPSWKKPKQQN